MCDRCLILRRTMGSTLSPDACWYIRRVIDCT
jgi:hypothetical protein